MDLGFLPRPDTNDFSGDDYPNAEWAAQSAIYRDVDRYYDGEIFKKGSGEPGEDKKKDLLYPLSINLVSTYCKLHAQALFGAYERDPIEWDVKAKDPASFPQPGRDGQEEAARKSAIEARDIVGQVWQENGLETLLLEQALTMQKYGGCIFGIRLDDDSVVMPSGIKLYPVSPHYFFPRWSPSDADQLLEVLISYPVLKATAELQYGITIGSGNLEVVYQEKWRKDSLEITVGDHALKQGDNPFGFIPFVYIPRVRAAGDFFGESLAYEIRGMQDELNLRMADVGDRINYTAHPVYTVKNYRGKAKDLRFSPDGIINLGMGTGDMEPDMNVLAPPGEPPGTFSFMEMMLNLTRMLTFSPPVAFGEDEGSQRSSLTIAMRMWPLLQQTRTTRTNLSYGLARLNEMVLKTKLMRDEAEDRTSRVQQRHLGHQIKPVYQPLMPRERLDLVNEVAIRWNGGDKPNITLEEIYQLLGHEKPEEMVEAVKELWQFLKELEPEPVNPFGATGQNPADNIDAREKTQAEAD